MKSVLFFIGSMIFGTMFFILIFRSVTRKKVELYYGKHDSFEHALMNNTLYLIISSGILLTFFSLYNSKFFAYILSWVPHIYEMLESGLFTNVALILVGVLINVTYKILSKILKYKINLSYLEKNEKTLLLIIGCIMLFTTGYIESDFLFSFSALALIAAYFFWVINNDLRSMKEKIRSLLPLSIYTIIFITAVLVILVVSLFIPKYFLQIIFGLIIGILIGIIICAFFYKKNNGQKVELSEMGMELKFRAWDNNKQTMEYICDLYWFNEKGVHGSDREGGNINYNFMTYSGMNDSKRTNELPEGQEVYEGDIIMDLDGNIYKVIFLNGKFIADAKSGIIGRKDLGIVVSEKAYVVGNIYEKDTLNF